MSFAIHWHESAVDLHVFPILIPSPISLSIPSLPSGSSQCTSPEHLSHASNLDWRSVSHLIIYMFQCYSLRSSHPRLLPQSPKVCSIHLCLSFCPGYRIIITIFLILYIRVSILYWCLSFWLTSLCIMGSSFIYLIRTDSNMFFLMAEWYSMVYVPQLLYPFVCWCTSMLLPCPGYYKQCCDKHWGTCVSFRSGFLSVYAQEWDCWVIWQFHFQFF